VFRAAQPGQRLSHLGLSWPHSEQAKVVRAGPELTVAIAGIMGYGSGRNNGAMALVHEIGADAPFRLDV
jgi:hypothetical protein